VSAAANAAIGGAQGASLLIGGAVAVVLSPRAIYAIAGILGVAAAIAIAVLHAVHTTRAERREAIDPSSLRPENLLSG
jgi:hypothetical protein